MSQCKLGTPERERERRERERERDINIYIYKERYINIFICI
jgi:hypothetical protein